MAKINAFRGYRPKPGLEKDVAARPYDVLNSKEARKEVEGNPHSFLRVTKPEVELPSEIDQYDERVYQQGRNKLDEFITNGTLIQEDKPAIYAYRQIWKDVEQTGLVVSSHIEDYFDDVIKKHEYTRPAKEADRIKHMRTLSAHVGPVFIAYPDVKDIDSIVDQATQGAPTYDFTAEDTVRHILWCITDEKAIQQLISLFNERVTATYIADGHHRAASSAKVGAALRDENDQHTGSEEYNWFLSVLFPASQLKIIDYNRVVKDLNGLTEEEFMSRLTEQFEVSSSDAAVMPKTNYEYGMYMGGKWHTLKAKAGSYPESHPVDSLDISVISDNLLAPILGIEDQRTSDRIDFVGGIRGLQELERRVDSGEMKLAFSIHPVSIEQLIAIADTGNVMPPKSTWFEPKLRSGLLVHRF